MSPPSWRLRKDSSNQENHQSFVESYLARSSIVGPLSVMLDELEAAQFESFFIQVSIDVSDPRVEESVKLIDPVEQQKH
jgi:hypothetical protein